MKAVIYCRMEASGQEVYRLALPWAEAAPEKEAISITGFYKEDQGQYVRSVKGVGYGEVTGISLEDGLLTLDVTCFSNKKDFTLKIGEKTFTKADFDETRTDGLELFEKCEEGDVLYRLASPAAQGKRPLLLFLHGGGNGGPKDGRDNEKHLLADYGPLNFALNYPDIYVMAPQAIELPLVIDPVKFKNMTFDDVMDPEHGWSRRYLGKVCDIIRRMIREGKVDEDRVYVTGFSMGGAGTIRMMSVGADLFAACVPVCPSMNWETFNILRSINAPVWAATSYVDHTIYRHKYIVDAVMEMKDRGNRNAHLTIYSPEDLAKYDIAVGDLTYEKRFSENHLSWVPTYHDEYGIMSWLLNQRKNDSTK